MPTESAHRSVDGENACRCQLTASGRLIQDPVAALGQVERRVHECWVGVVQAFVLHVQTLDLGLVGAEENIVVVDARLRRRGDGFGVRHGGDLDGRWMVSLLEDEMYGLARYR